MKFKRFIHKALLIVIMLSLSKAVVAQEVVTPQKAAQANLWHGFGKGYKMMGDTTTARSYSRIETAGWVATGVGTVGLLGTKITYEILVATVGRVTTADFYVFGGLTVVGLSTVIASRIISRNSILKPTVGAVSMADGQTSTPTIGITIDL